MLLAAAWVASAAAVDASGARNPPRDELERRFALPRTSTEAAAAPVRLGADRRVTTAPGDGENRAVSPALLTLILLGAGGAVAAVSVLLVRGRAPYTSAIVERVSGGARRANAGRDSDALPSRRVHEWLAHERPEETSPDPDAASGQGAEIVELRRHERGDEPRASAAKRQPTDTRADVGGAVSAIASAADAATTRLSAEKDSPSSPVQQKQLAGPAASRAGPAPGGESGAGHDYVERNRAAWQQWAPAHASAARDAWQKPLRWGIWGIPESELRLLARLGRGQDVIELGCGTAEVSAWLERRGARPVAVDVAPAQIETAKALQREFRLSFPLVCANAEKLEFDDETFDVALSEYGASLWCDPKRWLPEAHRLLRPDGRLIFFTSGALLLACMPPDGGPASDRLVRDYFGMRRVEFAEGGAVEFHPTHGEWVRLLHETGFVLEDLVEVRPPEGATPRYALTTIEWARRWPSEEIWIARKPA